jgi:hypothetical protein
VKSLTVGLGFQSEMKLMANQYLKVSFSNLIFEMVNYKSTEEFQILAKGKNEFHHSNPFTQLQQLVSVRKLLQKSDLLSLDIRTKKYRRKTPGPLVKKALEEITKVGGNIFYVTHSNIK